MQFLLCWLWTLLQMMKSESEKYFGRCWFILAEDVVLHLYYKAKLQSTLTSHAGIEEVTTIS